MTNGPECCHISSLNVICPSKQEFWGVQYFEGTLEILFWGTVIVWVHVEHEEISSSGSRLLWALAFAESLGHGHLQMSERKLFGFLLSSHVRAQGVLTQACGVVIVATSPNIVSAPKKSLIRKV